MENKPSINPFGFTHVLNMNASIAEYFVIQTAFYEDTRCVNTYNRLANIIIGDREPVDHMKSLLEDVEMIILRISAISAKDVAEEVCGGNPVFGSELSREEIVATQSLEGWLTSSINNFCRNLGGMRDNLIEIIAETERA